MSSPSAFILWWCGFLMSKPLLQSESLYRSRTGSSFCGSDIKIWAGQQYWKQKSGRLWATFEGRFFKFSLAKKSLNLFWKYCSVRTKKCQDNFFITFFLATYRLNIHVSSKHFSAWLLYSYKFVINLIQKHCCQSCQNRTTAEHNSHWFGGFLKILILNT